MEFRTQPTEESIDVGTRCGCVVYPRLFGSFFGWGQPLKDSANFASSLDGNTTTNAHFRFPIETQHQHNTNTTSCLKQRKGVPRT